MENSTKATKLNLKGIFAILGVILILGVVAFAYYSPSSAPVASVDTPPGIAINYSTSKGDIGQVVCSIPGAYPFTKDAVSADTSASVKLQPGIHIYHSDSDLTVQQVFDKIDAVNGNKILIAYYPSSIDPKGKFSIFPDTAAVQMKQDTLKLSDPIPANEGFTIFSCKESKIHGVKSETEYGSALPKALDVEHDSGWILMAAKAEDTSVKFKDSIGEKKKTNKKLKSAWPQKSGSDFNFGKETDEHSPDKVSLDTSYKMVWMEFGASAVETSVHNPITGLTAKLADDKKSITLNWTKPATTDTVSYLVTTNDATTGNKIDEKPATTETFSFANVIAGKSYRFAVDTIYSDTKNSGAVSSEIVPVPAGAEAKPVESLLAALSTDKKSITLTWNPPSTAESIKYSVVSYVDGSKLAESKDYTDTKFTLPNIAAGKSYYFTVGVIYSSGVSKIITSNTVDVPGGTIVQGVTNVVATLGKNKASADITWTAVSKPAGVIYTVYKYDSQGNKIGSGFGCSSGSCNIPLEAGKSYYFTVTAEYSDSSKSDEVKSNQLDIPVVIESTTKAATFSDMTPTIIEPGTVLDGSAYTGFMAFGSKPKFWLCATNLTDKTTALTVDSSDANITVKNVKIDTYSSTFGMGSFCGSGLNMNPFGGQSDPQTAISADLTVGAKEGDYTLTLKQGTQTLGTKTITVKKAAIPIVAKKLAAMEQLQVIPLTSTMISLAWKLPDSVSKENINHFTFNYGEGSVAGVGVVTSKDSINNSSNASTFSELKANTTYWLCVAAVDSTGQNGDAACTVYIPAPAITFSITTVSISSANYPPKNAGYDAEFTYEVKNVPSNLPVDTKYSIDFDFGDNTQVNPFTTHFEFNPIKNPSGTVTFIQNDSTTTTKHWYWGGVPGKVYNYTATLSVGSTKIPFSGKITIQ